MCFYCYKQFALTDYMCIFVQYVMKNEAKPNYYASCFSCGINEIEFGGQLCAMTLKDYLSYRKIKNEKEKEDEKTIYQKGYSIHSCVMVGGRR